MTKHETFYVSIETEENGYHVCRQRHFMGKYDAALLMTMKECIDSWLAKSPAHGDMTIDVIGNGTENYFHQSTIIRYIKHNWTDDGFRVIWFGDGQRGESKEFSSKKEAIKYYNQEYKKVADYIQF